MSEWRDLMPSALLGSGEVLETEWRGEDLLLYRNAAGECCAITAYCPHMGNYMPNGLPPGRPLSQLLQQGELRCPYHGWHFNEKGQCTHIPQGQPVPAAVRKGRPVARCWRIREEGQKIQIEMT